MKYIILLITFFVLCSCETHVPNTEYKLDVKAEGKTFIPYKTIVLDGCQYIQYNRGITHKGNCNNAFHK